MEGSPYGGFEFRCSLGLEYLGMCAHGRRITPSTCSLAGEYGDTGLYNLWLIPGWLKYDQLVHAYGFGITTWVCWQGLRTALLNRTGHAVPTLGLMILVVAAGMGFGAMNEVIEFGATLLLSETNVGGYLNTCLDMVANFIGTTVAAALIWYFESRTSVGE